MKLTAAVAAVTALTLTTIAPALAITAERRISLLDESNWVPRAECFDLPTGHGINIYFKPQIKINNFVNGIPFPFAPVSANPDEALTVSVLRVRSYRTDLPINASILSDNFFSNRGSYNSLTMSTAKLGQGTHFLGLPFSGKAIIDGLMRAATYYSIDLNLDPGSNMGGRTVAVTWSANLINLGLDNVKWKGDPVARVDVFSCPGMFNESMRGYRVATKRSTQQFLGLVK